MTLEQFSIVVLLSAPVQLEVSSGLMTENSFN